MGEKTFRNISNAPVQIGFHEKMEMEMEPNEDINKHKLKHSHKHSPHVNEQDEDSVCISCASEDEKKFS